jgi:hypothetical protein
MRIVALCAWVALPAVACEATSERARSEGDAGSGGTQSSGGSGGSGAFGEGGSTFATGTGGGGTGSGGVESDCSATAQLVYVLSDANELYSFKPDAKQFTRIGRLGCQTSMQPNSMAVDRDAVAWVNYVQTNGLTGLDDAGQIFKVSTTDASCEPTSISLTNGWFRLGMGFSTDDAGGTSERLFITGTASQGSSSPGLGRLDPGANTVAPVGAFTGQLRGSNAELTGTGDGRLFGFFTTTPVQLAEIDKASGAILSATQLQGVETPAAWAFSFWGGDFYLYTAPGLSGRTSNVTRYRPSDGSIDTAYMTNVGFRIVGAGVSTCAPLESPR